MDGKKMRMLDERADGKKISSGDEERLLEWKGLYSLSLSASSQDCGVRRTLMEKERVCVKKKMKRGTVGIMKKG